MNNPSHLGQDRRSFEESRQGMNSQQGLPQTSVAHLLRPSSAQDQSMAQLGLRTGAIGPPAAAMLPSAQNDPQHMSLSFGQELKRLQHLHQLTNSTASPLLMAQTQRQSFDPSSSLLQSYLEQKVHTQRFDDPLRMTLGMAPQTQPILKSQLLQDPRFLMAHSAMAPAAPVTQQMGMHPPGQPEVPLPSPHSLFHRDGSRRMRGGVIEPFPEKLHRLLLEVEAAGRSDVISFVANGRAFAIHKPDKFFKEIVPLYFRQSRLSSFKRQLNLYGFELINTGPARGGYYHELFVKNQPDLCRRMRRVAVKVAAKSEGGKDTEGSKDKKPSSTTADDEKTSAKEREGSSPTVEVHGSL